MKPKHLIDAAMLLLLICGITFVVTKQVHAYRLQIWQKRMDTSALDNTPRQAKIVPTRGPRPQSATGWESYHGMYLGWNVSLPQIIRVAYNVQPPRLLFAAPVPGGNYDFICNVAKNQDIAMQEEIKKEFGLTGRRVSITTNVFALTLVNHKTTGLKPYASPGVKIIRTNGFAYVSNFPMSALAQTFEGRLGIPVVDRTGLKGCADIRWDGTADSLKQNVLTNLGLDLIPTQDKVEFVVMEKAN